MISKEKNSVKQIGSSIRNILYILNNINEFHFFFIAESQIHYKNIMPLIID